MQIRALLMAAATIAASILAAVGQETPAEEEYIKIGGVLYEFSCASCHGLGGRGDGPAAGELKTPPADLTQLSRSNGGVFPMDFVIETIDGRNTVRAHGSAEMPVWGIVFLTDFERFTLDTGSDDEAMARRRIKQLADYVATIQQP